MSRNATMRIVALLLLLGGLLLGIFAWQEWQHAVVLVEWSTASELDTVGFNLFRSETEEGPYTQVNESLIPSAGDALSGSDYRFEDRNVRAGVLYYYQLEDVGANGAGTRHGPITVRARGQIGYKAVVALALLLSAAMLWQGTPAANSRGSGQA